jgi:hypothetical protein
MPSDPPPRREERGIRPMAGVVKQPCDEEVIRSKGAKSPCAPNAAPWVLVATILGSSMAFIDETALPSWRCPPYKVPWEQPRSTPNG